MSNEIDLFPQYCGSMTKLENPSITQIFNATPFRCCLRDIKVKLNPLQRNSDEYDKAISTHSTSLLKEALKPKRDGPEICWDKVRKRLSRCQSPKKNMDVALALRIGDAYLTNSRFTFGLMQPRPGFCHIYQTGEKPLLFYLPKSPSMPYLEKTFRWSSRSEYACFILDPKSEYLVRENLSYLILTIDKSWFGAGIRSMSDVELSNYKIPTENPLKQSTDQIKRRLDVSFNHSRQWNPYLQNSVRSVATTSQAFQEIDPKYLLTANPSSGQRSDNNLTMSPMENSLEAPVDQPTSQRNPVAQSTTNGRATQSKKRKHESAGEEANVSHSRHSQQWRSSTKQAARPENTRHSPSHRNSDLNIRRTSQNFSDRYAPTSSNARQQNISENANSSTLNSNSLNFPVLSSSSKEDEHSSYKANSSTEDEPSSYVEVDDLGNRYKYVPINMNWSENENRPLNKIPIMKFIKGRCYTFVPIKLKV